MNTILHILYLGVQALRLILSACIVVPAILLIGGFDRMRTPDFGGLLFISVYIFWVFAFIALNRIVKVIKSCKRGDFFAESNAPYIRFLAYVLIIYSIGLPVIKFVLKIINEGRLELSYAFDLDYAFVSHLSLGLILMLLAKIVERGRALKIDQDLTI